MYFCYVCGAQIEDAGVLLAKGLNPPRLCEPCRHRIRDYRAKMIVRHELQDVRLVKLGEQLCRWLRPEGDAREGTIPQRARIYSIGGRMFGPWGGAEHGGKYLIFSYIPAVEEGNTVLIRKMKKIAEGGQWIYFVLEPPPDGEETDLVLELQFTRVYKTTLKGFGRQFDERHPIEVPHEVILSGWSRARKTGRFGNEWVLYIYREEGEKGGRE